jgi:hypothetical protein
MSIFRLTTLVALNLFLRRAYAYPSDAGLTFNPAHPVKSFTDGATSSEHVEESSDDNSTLITVASQSPYQLYETYDASNWISKFDVKDVSFIRFIYLFYLESSHPTKC